MDTMLAAGQIIDRVMAAGPGRYGFWVCPQSGAVGEIVAAAGDVPLLTVDGDVQDLASILQSFDGWKSPIVVGVLLDEGLLDFWITDLPAPLSHQS